MSDEIGIFTDEGCIDRGFYSREEAQAELDKSYAEDDAHLGEFCHDHPENEKDGCPECATAEKIEEAEIVVRGEAVEVSSLTDAQVSRACALIAQLDLGTVSGRAELAKFCAEHFARTDSVFDAGSRA